jgi:NADH-quinone oxidoreductase subunit A
MLFLYNNYILLCSIFIAILIPIIFVLISYFLITREAYIEKNSAYECGFQPFEDARVPFDIHFYLVGLLFMIFDLELLFLIPWATNVYFMSDFSFNIILIFFFILTLGFIYE